MFNYFHCLLFCDSNVKYIYLKKAYKSPEEHATYKICHAISITIHKLCSLFLLNLQREF